MSLVSIAGRHRQLLAPSNTDADARVPRLASRIELVERVPLVLRLMYLSVHLKLPHRTEM